MGPALICVVEVHQVYRLEVQIRFGGQELVFQEIWVHAVYFGCDVFFCNLAIFNELLLEHGGRSTKICIVWQVPIFRGNEDLIPLDPTFLHQSGYSCAD